MAGARRNKRKRTHSTFVTSADDTTPATTTTQPTSISNDAETPGIDTTQSSPALAATSVSGNIPRKRQKREEYRSKSHVDEENGLAELPRKKFYRQRAHANPFSDHTLHYPRSPSQMNWSSHFPKYITQSGNNSGYLIKNVDVADVGCGFGGLLFALAPMMPDSLILGLEIRVSVTEFVRDKIRALRHQAANPNAIPPPVDPSQPLPPVPFIPPGTTFQNISALRTNTMKFLPNFFPPASLSALFLCFPDPHFKARKHKARIVSATLCAEYFWVIKPGGRVYTITDVEDLAAWMAGRFDAHPGFRRVREVEWRDVEAKSDSREKDGVKVDSEGAVEAVKEGEWGPAHDFKARLMLDETEEGKKVSRNGGQKFVGIWERLETPAWSGEEDG